MELWSSLYKKWMSFGEWIGDKMAIFIFSILFVLVIIPIGAFRKVLGKDPISKTFDKNLKTYRIKSERTSIDHMQRPF